MSDELLNLFYEIKETFLSEIFFHEEAKSSQPTHMIESNWDSLMGWQIEGNTPHALSGLSQFEGYFLEVNKIIPIPETLSLFYRYKAA